MHNNRKNDVQIVCRKEDSLMEDKNVFNITDGDNIANNNTMRPTNKYNTQIGLVKELFYEELIIVNNYESRDVS